MIINVDAIRWNRYKMGIFLYQTAGNVLINIRLLYNKRYKYAYVGACISVPRLFIERTKNFDGIATVYIQQH